MEDLSILCFVSSTSIGSKYYFLIFGRDAKKSLFGTLKINKKKKTLQTHLPAAMLIFLKHTPIDSINESTDLKKVNLLVIAPASHLSGAHKLE